MINHIMRSPFIVPFAFLFILIATMNVIWQHDQQFVLLAESFLHGKTYFLIEEPVYDSAFFNGRYFFPLGPFPAILLVPFVFFFSMFGAMFLQGYVNIALAVFVAYCWVRIARALGYTDRDAYWWTSTFCIGSAFIAVVFFPAYAHFAHMITAALLCVALFEYLTKKRFWVIGTAVALAIATRVTAGGASLFFLLAIFFLSHEPLRARVRQAALFCAPIMGVGFGLAVYNYIRFEHILETGYALQLISERYPALSVAREYGLMALRHLPGNLYYFFLAPPQPVFADGVSHVLKFPFVRPDPWGMSILITSPYLIWLLFFRIRDRLSWFLLAGIGAIALPLFLYYGIGFRQYGYRYAIDFMPFAFLLLMYIYKHNRGALTRGMRAVLGCAIVINLYLFFAYFFYG